MPRIHRTGGGSTIVASAGGYAASLHAIGVTPSADPRAIAAAARARIDAPFSGSSAHRSTNRRSNTRPGDSPERSRSLMSRHSQIGSSESAMRSERLDIGGHALRWCGDPTSSTFIIAVRPQPRRRRTAFTAFRKSNARKSVRIGRFWRLSHGTSLALFLV